MKSKLLLSILLLSACGPGECLDFEELNQDDGRFYRYRAFFEKHTGHRTHKIKINYGKSKSAASCKSRRFGGKWHSKQIIVNPGLFDGLGLNHRRALIAHELIHCHLEESGHLPQPEGSEFVLMAPAIPIDRFISTDELIEELEYYK